MAHQNLSRIERGGKFGVKMRTAERIAEALGESLSTLLAMCEIEL